MSYSIRYGQDTKQEMAERKRHAATYLAAGALGAAALAGFLFPQVGDALRRILFPWINEASIAAFSEMIASIGVGNPVPAAVLDFCRDIISYAWIPV